MFGGLAVNVGQRPKKATKKDNERQKKHELRYGQKHTGPRSYSNEYTVDMYYITCCTVPTRVGSMLVRRPNTHIAYNV